MIGLLVGLTTGLVTLGASLSTGLWPEGRVATAVEGLVSMLDLLLPLDFDPEEPLPDEPFEEPELPRPDDEEGRPLEGREPLDGLDVEGRLDDGRELEGLLVDGRFEELGRLVDGRLDELGLLLVVGRFDELGLPLVVGRFDELGLLVEGLLVEGRFEEPDPRLLEADEGPDGNDLLAPPTPRDEPLERDAEEFPGPVWIIVLPDLLWPGGEFLARATHGRVTLVLMGLPIAVLPLRPAWPAWATAK